MFLSNLKDLLNTRNQRTLSEAQFPAAMDHHFGIYSQEQFREMLSLETKRSQRSSRPFLLMLLNIAKGVDERERLYILKRVALVLNKITRDIDIKGWYRYERSIGVIFTEIRSLSGRAVQSRIHQKIHEGLLKGLHFDQVSKIEITFQSQSNGDAAPILNGNSIDEPAAAPTHSTEAHETKNGGARNACTADAALPGSGDFQLESSSEGRIEYGFNRQRFMLLLGDLALVGLAGILGTLFRFGPPLDALRVPLAPLAVAAVLYPTLLYIFDMYNVSRSFRGYDSVVRTMAAAVFASLLCGLAYYFIPEAQTGRGVLLLQAAVLLVSLVLWRLAFHRLLQETNSRTGVLVVGAGESGQAICRLLNSPVSPYQVRGLLDDDPGRQGQTVESCLVLGKTDQIQQVMNEIWAKTAILATPRNGNRGLVRQVLEARLRGVEVLEMSQIYENLTGRVPVRHIQDEWFLYADGFYLLSKEFVQKFKRLIDIFSSGLLLLLSSPVILITAVAIRLDSPGPVFYRQSRVGKLGKVFSIVKFRSMFENAEAKGIKWATKRDPRVTRVGRWIRLFRIDEIPQLWNVLKGEMSLVGPRPERPEFVKELESVIPYYAVRHCVAPGVTGWAQVNYPYGASVEDALHKLEYDLYYIKKMSIFLDLKIALKTIGVVLIGDGAR